MKKLNIFLFSALTLGITTVSCSKEETSEATILGKWTFDTATRTKGSTTDAPKPYNNPACSDKNYLDLKADGILAEQLVDNTCKATVYAGNYTYENSELKIVEGYYKITYKVIAVTPNKLTLKNVNPQDATEYYIFTLKK